MHLEQMPPYQPETLRLRTRKTRQNHAAPPIQPIFCPHPASPVTLLGSGGSLHRSRRADRQTRRGEATCQRRGHIVIIHGSPTTAHTRRVFACYCASLAAHQTRLALHQIGCSPAFPAIPETKYRIRASSSFYVGVGRGQGGECRLQATCSRRQGFVLPRLLGRRRWFGVAAQGVVAAGRRGRGCGSWGDVGGCRRAGAGRDGGGLGCGRCGGGRAR